MLMCLLAAQYHAKKITAVLIGVFHRLSICYIFRLFRSVDQAVICFLMLMVVGYYCESETIICVKDVE
jgi:hypothetical protein